MAGGFFVLGRVMRHNEFPNQNQKWKEELKNG
jgi:hypothetical protein